MSHAPPILPRSTSGGALEDLTRTATVILERRRPIALSSLMGLLIIAAAAIIPSRQYESHITFVPAAADQTLGLLGGVAAQLGLGGAQANIGSPDYYADLAGSTGVLSAVASGSVRTSSDSTLVTVADLFDISGAPGPKRTQKTSDALRRRLTAQVSPTSGIVTMSVSTSDPVASRDLVVDIFSRLSSEDRRTRNAQAAAEHRYATSQVEASRNRLKAAEDSLQSFLVANREFRNSPKLSFQYDRLQRAVDLEQQLFTSLSQTEQSAAMDEVRNTPTLSILDSSSVSALPLSRHLLLKCTAGLFIGALLAVFIALLKERALLAEGLDSHERLKAAAQATASDISAVAMALNPKRGRKR